jgi:hypothetical protein
MAFLDNSGDIILDAVLTDAGRKRLAEGNGSFRITKYAFSDDEIDYGNYDASNSSGSAYYDLQILQTPILEAFTNNTATMKSKLMTLTNNNILYLPVIVLNNIPAQAGGIAPVNNSVGSGSTVVAVDYDTQKKFSDTSSLGSYIDGTDPSSTNSINIRCDQGLNTTEISNTYKVDAELQENQYIVEIDNRFGSIVTGQGMTADPGTSVQGFSFIDDDNIASYYLSDQAYIKITDAAPIGNQSSDLINTAIAGPRGTHLVFRVKSSTNLRTSTYLFNKLGSTFSFLGINYLFIDSVVRVTGATTGYRLDIPVRYIKQSS